MNPFKSREKGKKFHWWSHGLNSLCPGTLSRYKAGSWFWTGHSEKCNITSERIGSHVSHAPSIGDKMAWKVFRLGSTSSVSGVPIFCCLIMLLKVILKNLRNFLKYTKYWPLSTVQSRSLTCCETSVFSS